MCKAATSLGIAGNDLNRCDVPALQRKNLEQSEKEELYSLQTVGKGWCEWEVEGGKGLLWIVKKERLVQKKVFLREKAVFADSKKWFKQAVFCLRKREAFQDKASSFL